YLGLKKNLTAIEIREAIAHNALENWMNAISVSKGDSFYIPAGLFHAIGKGCLIYEVQQNSNTTYRLYDWDRKDHNGQPRPLHIDEALSVMLN
ncbi:class I mannose-6-phosphate isomerase, partial [Pseudomonas neuropathica]|uniref:class I mannose-6-phosphate isomerase n=1 Tax=Pseudomonas neuropathica TaxID=2730425 RepID=UPI0034D652AC